MGGLSSSHALAKMRRQADTAEARIEAVLQNPANWPADWDRMLDRAGDLQDRIAATNLKTGDRHGHQAA